MNHQIFYIMELKPGMTFTIEPMINAGKFATKMLNDGWTAVTKDKSLSAQFEHTLGTVSYTHLRAHET